MLMRSSGTERIFNQLVRNDGNELSNRLVGYWLSYITSITDRNMRPLLRQNIFFFFLNNSLPNKKRRENSRWHPHKYTSARGNRDRRVLCTRNLN
jgi:hypothetical protein